MTDKDLDFSGFQTERKVDVPPPPKKTPPGAVKPKSERKKAKKGKKDRKPDDLEKESATPKVEDLIRKPEPAEPAKRPSPRTEGPNPQAGSEEARQRVAAG